MAPGSVLLAALLVQLLVQLLVTTDEPRGTTCAASSKSILVPSAAEE
jgi:hypothetical protein